MSLTTTDPMGHGYVVTGEEPPRHGQVRVMFYGVWCELLYGPDREGAYVLIHPSGTAMRARWQS